jgi:type IV secretory pathway ATPase VirB11/archaellum biosynthesis ATPase
MQCRYPSLEGTGGIKLRRLVKEALRKRPSRIVVGEVRQEESPDLLIALNSGLAERRACAKTSPVPVAGLRACRPAWRSASGVTSPEL